MGRGNTGKVIGMANISISTCEVCGYKIKNHVRIGGSQNTNVVREASDKCKLLCKTCKKKMRKNVL